MTLLPARASAGTETSRRTAPELTDLTEALRPRLFLRREIVAVLIPAWADDDADASAYSHATEAIGAVAWE